MGSKRQAASVTLIQPYGVHLESRWVRWTAWEIITKTYNATDLSLGVLNGEATGTQGKENAIFAVVLFILESGIGWIPEPSWIHSVEGATF